MADVSKFDIDNVEVNIKDTVARAPTFSVASSRANIASGESTSTMFGKIAKWFNDLKNVAFSGSYSDLTGVPTDNIKIERLWVNSSPDAAQSAGNITLSSALSNYDFYMLTYKPVYDQPTVQNSGFISVNNSVVLNGYGTATFLPMIRTCSPVSGKTFSIGGGSYYSSMNGNTATFGGACVVTAVYGVKRG